jgi:uncharacterized protein (UPF0332 family)
MKIELRQILEKAESKLKTARIDFDNGQYDDAISRAYYAVFHAISAGLLSRQLVFSSHSQVVGAFNKEFVKAGIVLKEFTAIIQRLFADRQTGDYDIIDVIDKETAAEGIRNAVTILSAVRSNLETIS